MTIDADRYAALEGDWNMGPFYVVVSADNGEIAGASEGGVMLYRKVGPHFFSNAKARNQIVRLATVTLIGKAVEG